MKEADECENKWQNKEALFFYKSKCLFQIRSFKILVAHKFLM